MHRARIRRRGRPLELEDALFSIVLANLVAWSDPLTGSAFRSAVGLPADSITTERFQAWFTSLIRDHLAR
jgi:hypothetical protein